MTRLIAVTGATGRQGGAAVRRLVEAGLRVRALTRHRDSPAALALAALPGCELATCDLERPMQVAAALEGAKGLFLTTTPYESGLEAEVRQACSAIDSAAASGVEQIVYSSVADSQSSTGQAHFESKGRVEFYLADAPLRFVTVLRPTFFMEMFLLESFRAALARGAIRLAMSPQTRVSMISVDDIARFAAAAFQAPERFDRKTIDLAGDSPSLAGVATALTQALGFPVAYEQVPPAQLSDEVRPKLATQKWLEQVGWQVDVHALASAYGITPTSLVQWATSHRHLLAGKEAAL